MFRLKYLLCAALGAATALSGVAPAHAAIDTAAPALASFSFTPAGVDVTAGTDQVVITARVTDDTGAVPPGFTVTSDTTTQTIEGQLALVSGTAQDGTYEATVDVPETAAAGAWTVAVAALADTVGNKESAAHSNPTKLTVTSAASDTAPPAVASFSFTPAALNVTTGPKQVTVTARITDATGVTPPSATISSDTSTQSARGNLTLISGTPQDGTYQGTFDIPATAAPGAWTVSLSSLRDTVGNDDRVLHPNPTKLVLISNATDVAAPALMSFAFTPTTADASVDLNRPGGASVAVTARVTDASGAVPPVAVLTSDTTAQSARATLTLVSGTPQDGTYQGTVNLPATAAPGAWTVALDELRDPLGNTDRTVHRHATKLTVLNDDALRAPAPPTAVTATRGDQTALVSWTAANPNRSPVTGYTITASPGGATQTVGGNATSGTVSGLTNGISYTFTVKATNAIGSSAPSAPSAAVTPAGLPGAPTGVTAVRGDKSAQVTWNVPLVNGSPITTYTITATPGGSTVTVAGDKTVGTVTGLTNNTPYTFTVRATNAIGASPLSAPSNAVTPSAVPAPPSTVTAVRGDKSAQVTWSASSGNGSTVTGYTVTSNPGGITTSVGATTTTTVNGLTNGTAYTFTVTATNAIGTSPSSAPSAPVTPASVPAAPTNVVATRGDKSALVTWTAAVDNGSPLTTQTVTASPGGVTQVVSGSSTSATLNGLTNGTAYTFTVKSTSALGTSPSSLPSAPVTPAGAPAAPSSVVATRGNGSALVSWAAPATNGAPISSYTVTTSPGGGTTVVAGGTTSATVRGLTNSTSYSFTVTATNAVGTSPASAPSSVLAPAGVPDAPTDVTVSRRDSSVALEWTAPDANGTPITGYVVTASPGGLTWTLGDTTGATLTGLTNGTTYTFTVKAVNGIGASAPSAESDAVTPAGLPGRVKTPTATVKKRTVTLRWAAPSANGSPITGYTVSSPTGPPTTVTGLSARLKLKPGRYTFYVTAHNELGDGAQSRAVKVRIR